MSTLVSRSLDINHDNCQTYGTHSENVGWSSNGIISGKTENLAYYTLNSAAKDVLYPNAAAHPEKADLSGGVNRDSYFLLKPTAYASIQFGGADIISGSSNSETTVTFSRSGVTDANVVGSVKDTVICGTVHGSNTTYAVRLISMTITLYFTRYDFSAVAGTGVTSASVSSSTGYDGDSIIYSCVIPTGYVFDGWYNGNTLVSSSQSYTQTVSGADLTLTAKAHQSTHSVNGTYNGSTKAILTGITGDVSVGYNGKSKTLNASSASHTLSCSGKVMHGNVSVGSASLATGGKIMRSDLALNYV